MEEEFTGLIVERSDFALEKVVMSADKSLSVKFMLAKADNDGIFTADCQLSYKHQSNEAFQQKLNELHPYICKYRNVDNDVAVKVKGLTITGSDDTEGFKILATHYPDVNDDKKKSTADTCKIHYEDSIYAWAGEVKLIADDIEDLVFNYLFAGEKAELTLPINNATDIEDVDAEDVTEKQNEEENE